MLRRVQLGEIGSRLTRPADTMPVRAMALICFGIAALLLFGLLANSEQLPVTQQRRIITVCVVTAMGILYWTTARHFREWMLHAIILIGLVLGFTGVARMTTATAAAMAILTVLWICLLIGSIFRPPVARVYGGITFLGIGLSLRDFDGTAAENIVMALGFGLTMIVTMELISQTSSRLRDEATHDPLTGLLNRNGLVEAAELAKRVAIRRGEPISIVSFDLNQFKAVNDREGHLAGDNLLTRCAEVWSSNVRPDDVLARPGGDEFVLMLPGARREQAEETMRRLQDVSPVSFTYGIAVAMPGDSIEEKLREADAELIRSKAVQREAAQTAKTPS